jgi:hypothetical protein
MIARIILIKFQKLQIKMKNILFNNFLFSENRAVWDNVEKYGGATP